MSKSRSKSRGLDGACGGYSDRSSSVLSMVLLCIEDRRRRVDDGITGGRRLSGRCGVLVQQDFVDGLGRPRCLSLGTLDCRCGGEGVQVHSIARRENRRKRK